MSRIYPVNPLSIASCSSSNQISETETFTIWMKSLVVNGNGYTVYDSYGKIVYRIDNYDTKCCSQVYLMDLRGNILSTIIRKKLLQLGLWDGYKSNHDSKKNEKPWFKVKKTSSFFKRKSSNSSYIVDMEREEGCEERNLYTIEGSFAKKSQFCIRDSEGRIVAEVKQKQSNNGVMLKDVLSLKVEPFVNHSLIMSLVAVYGLISGKM